MGKGSVRTTMPVHPINATFAMVSFFGIIQVEGCECQRKEQEESGCGLRASAVSSSVGANLKLSCKADRAPTMERVQRVLTTRPKTA